VRAKGRASCAGFGDRVPMNVRSRDIIHMKGHRPRIDQKHERRIATARRRLAKARQLAGGHVPPTVSLVDEMIAEPRKLGGRVIHRDELF
jgi:hypothetical protein